MESKRKDKLLALVRHNGDSALHAATYMDNLDLVKLLIKHGAGMMLT
jgi:ankyrin repeat protein